VKRELVLGELRDRRRAALPVVAAVGGMIVAALVYTALNRSGIGGDGWGIPMATDIAFAIGVLALVAPKIPAAVRLFLLTLAIATTSAPSSSSPSSTPRPSTCHGCSPRSAS